MDIRITPGPLAGTAVPPPSKSQAHRAILALLLAEGEGTISNLTLSRDIEATQRCAAALKSGHPAGRDGLPLLDCGESGSTLRFLIPIALALRGGGHFSGQGRLMARPQKPYFDIFDEKGIFYEQRDGILTVRGKLPAGEYRLPGNVSSQFVTGLLYALPLLDGDSQIVLTSPLESRGYVDMTLETLENFGVTVENRGYALFSVRGNQKFQAGNVTIEADWSQAAFWLAAGSLGNPVVLDGVPLKSCQGDRVIMEHKDRLCREGNADIDVSDCPDLVPPLAVMAAFHGGTTRLTNAARLRLKESDRLQTTAAMLSALGAGVEELPDGLVIHGVPKLSGGTVDGANDHRIVMAAAIAATRCTGPVTILGAEAVNKSYPSFWEEYRRLGGEFDVL